MKTQITGMKLVVLSGCILACMSFGCEWDPGRPDAGVQAEFQTIPAPVEAAISAHEVDGAGFEQGGASSAGPPGMPELAGVSARSGAGGDAYLPVIEFAFPHVDREATDHMALAKAMLVKTDKASAMLELEKALYDDPENYAAAFLLGQTARDAGRIVLATDAFLLASQIDTDEDDPWLEMARLALSSKKLDEAERLVRRALRLNPKRALAHNVLGRVWLTRSHWERAIARFEKALELSPDSPYYRNNLGFALLLRRDYQRAVKVLEPLAGKTALQAFMYNNLGLAFEGAGRLQDSVASFKRALEVNPGYVNARVNLDRLVQVAKHNESMELPSETELDEPEIVGDDLIVPSPSEL